MHYGRVHSKTIVALGQKRPERALVRFNGTGNGGTAVALEEQPVKVDRRTRAWREAHPDEVKKPQSTYWAGMTKEERSAEIKRRMKKRTSKHAAVQEVTINFCPECGCHIKAVAMGMAVAAHMKG